MNEKDLEKLVFGIAHQIRNPCAIILANARIAQSDKDISEKVYRSLESVVNGAKYIESRLDEFVEFSKPLILKYKELSLNQLAREVESIVNENCRIKRIRLASHFDANIILTKADRQQLLLAILNVVLNAIESITESGTISLRCREAEPNDELIVEDNGIGIHPRDLPEVFSPFYSTKQGGLGIGLAVAKRIIEAHKGKISLESQSGKGTIVKIVLPK